LRRKQGRKKVSLQKRKVKKKLCIEKEKRNMSWNNVSSELYRLDSNTLRENAG
jgi:hypothetical protein